MVIPPGKSARPGFCSKCGWSKRNRSSASFPTVVFLSLFGVLSGQHSPASSLGIRRYCSLPPRSSSKGLASFKSGRSKPSVNQSLAPLLAVVESEIERLPQRLE